MNAAESLFMTSLIVRGKLEDIEAAGGPMPKWGEDDYQARYDLWRKARAQELERVKAFLVATSDARFTSKPPHDHAVKMLGIRASSTSDFIGALNNWFHAASRRIETMLDEPLDATNPCPVTGFDCITCEGECRLSAEGGKADRPSEPVRGPVRSAGEADSVRTKP